jgi:hypothetical protein
VANFSLQAMVEAFQDIYAELGKQEIAERRA